MSAWLGIDVGGTFTDLLLLDERDGGEMALDPDASSAAVGKVARALGLDVLDFVLDKRLVSCGKMPAQEEARCISMLHDTKPTICSSSRVFGRAYQSPTQ